MGLSFHLPSPSPQFPPSGYHYGEPSVSFEPAPSSPSAKPSQREVSLGDDFLLHYGLYQYFSHGSTYLCDPYGGIEIICTRIAEEPRVFIDGFIKRTHAEDEFVRVNLWNMPGNGITADVLEKFHVDGDDETKGGKGEASNWRVKMKAGITDTIEAKDIKQVEPRSSCLPGIMIGTNFLAEKEAHIDYRKQLIYIKEDHHYECFALKLEF